MESRANLIYSKMKNYLWYCFLILVIGFIVFKFWLNNPQSSSEELQAVFAEATAKADSFPVSYNTDQWEIDTYGSSISYSQHPDWSWDSPNEYSENLKFFISKDKKKIVMLKYDFKNASKDLGGGVSFHSFGSAYSNYRVFRNADDFKKKFERLIKDRSKKLTSTDDLRLKKYYPAFNWKNWMLSFHDDDQEYEYEK